MQTASCRCRRVIGVSCRSLYAGQIVCCCLHVCASVVYKVTSVLLQLRRHLQLDEPKPLHFHTCTHHHRLHTSSHYTTQQYHTPLSPFAHTDEHTWRTSVSMMGVPRSQVDRQCNKVRQCNKARRCSKAHRLFRPSLLRCSRRPRSY